LDKKDPDFTTTITTDSEGIVAENAMCSVEIYPHEDIAEAVFENPQLLQISMMAAIQLAVALPLAEHTKVLMQIEEKWQELARSTLKIIQDSRNIPETQEDNTTSIELNDQDYDAVSI